MIKTSSQARHISPTIRTANSQSIYLNWTASFRREYDIYQFLTQSLTKKQNELIWDKENHYKLFQKKI